jgi:hypothetical protein
MLRCVSWLNARRKTADGALPPPPWRSPVLRLLSREGAEVIPVAAAASPKAHSLNLVLHIGTAKTGTSSIQAFLHRNRQRLADIGYLYPVTPGARRHRRLGLFVQPAAALPDTPGWDREGFSSAEAFRKAFRRRLFTEINRSELSHVLMSEETLYGSPDQALRRLSRFTHRIAGNLRLVVYLRRQDDHLVSRYQQLVKVGETRRLAERMQQLDFSKAYDHFARLCTWKDLVAPDEFVVRRFERDSFVDGSLYQDFLDAAGINTRADELEPVEEPLNESLDAEAVEFLRILNIVRAENDTAATLPPGNRPLVVRLAAASGGPTLTLPTASLDRFMARWDESNRRVAREFLDDQSGQLFRMPRRTGNTTAEQHLDPDRLDHFVALLGLPEQMHAPLRRAAQREADKR